MNETKSRKCQAINKNGEPCNAYAIRGSSPPRCSSHAGLTGAQLGNQNRRTHGFYSRKFTAEEAADLVTHAQNITLDDEIAVFRILLHRLLSFMQSDEKMKVTTYLAIVEESVKVGRTIGYLVRMVANQGSPLWDDILDSVGDELGMDL